MTEENTFIWWTSQADAREIVAQIGRKWFVPADLKAVIGKRADSSDHGVILNDLVPTVNVDRLPWTDRNQLSGIVFPHRYALFIDGFQKGFVTDTANHRVDLNAILDADAYGPESVKILEGLEPVRKRPEGFITDESPLTMEQAAEIVGTDTVLIQRALSAGKLKSLHYADVLAHKKFKAEQARLMTDIYEDMDGYEPPNRPALDDLPEDARREVKEFLDDLRATPPTPTVRQAIDAASFINEKPTSASPLPPPKGKPTRSADSPPTSPKPKR